MQNVGTPRFYIDYLSYLESIGIVRDYKVWEWADNTIDGKFYGLDITDPCYLGIETEFKHITGSVDFTQYLGKEILESINYVGILGHNLNTFSNKGRAPEILFKLFNRDEVDSPIGQHQLKGYISPRDIDAPYIINADVGKNADYFKTQNQGFSLLKASINSVPSYDVDRIAFTIHNFDDNNNSEGFLGTWLSNSICVGHYYDMPHSPDLELSLETEYDGYDSITTLGGSTLTKINYHGSPKWGGGLNPWEIGTNEIYDGNDDSPTYGEYTRSDFTRRNGRRVWNLKFIYVSDKDLFASNYMSNTYLNPNSSSTEYADGDIYEDNWALLPIRNSDFDDWTGDNLDDWRTILNESSPAVETTNTKITEVTTDVVRFLYDADENTGSLVLQPTVAAPVDGSAHYHRVLEIGKTYKWELKINSIAAGTIRVTSKGYEYSMTGAGTYSDTFQAAAAEMRITCPKNTDTDAQLSYFTLKVLNPNDFTYTLADDDSISAKLLNFIGNGQRFIFQADSTSSNPSDFALCVLDQDSFKMTQVAYKVYNFDMKIREVW